MKYKLLAIAFGALTGIGAVASPVPAVPGGPLFVQFTNREQIAVKGTTGFAFAPGEINWGVLIVSAASKGIVTGPNSIEDGGLGSFFSNVTSGGQITGIFYDIKPKPPGTGGNPFPATGGFIDLYYRDLSSMSTTLLASASTPNAAGFRTAIDKATGFTEGTLLAHLAFASGVNPDPTVFINGDLVPTSTGPFTGHADSYANVLPSAGVWTTLLNTDFFFPSNFFGSRDLAFKNSYQELASWNGSLAGCGPAVGNCVIGARSTDPVTAFAIPEPGSMALVGLGLIGVASIRRRRRV